MKQRSDVFERALTDIPKTNPTPELHAYVAERRDSFCLTRSVAGFGWSVCAFSKQTGTRYKETFLWYSKAREYFDMLVKKYDAKVSLW